MPTCPGRDNRRMRYLAKLAKLKREGLAEEAAFLVALKGLIEEELTCQLTLAERIALGNELAHVSDHLASTANLGSSSLVGRLTIPWHIYELPEADVVGDSLLASIQRLSVRSRRLQ